MPSSAHESAPLALRVLDMHLAGDARNVQDALKEAEGCARAPRFLGRSHVQEREHRALRKLEDKRPAALVHDGAQVVGVRARNNFEGRLLSKLQVGQLHDPKAQRPFPQSQRDAPHHAERRAPRRHRPMERRLLSPPPCGEGAVGQHERVREHVIDGEAMQSTRERDPSSRQQPRHPHASAAAAYRVQRLAAAGRSSVLLKRAVNVTPNGAAFNVGHPR